MTSPEEFLTYLSKINGGTVAVDLMKLGNSTQKPSGSTGGAKSAGNLLPKMHLALDMEDCLDRFYGGYYSGSCTCALRMLR